MVKQPKTTIGFIFGDRQAQEVRTVSWETRCVGCGKPSPAGRTKAGRPVCRDCKEKIQALEDTPAVDEACPVHGNASVSTTEIEEKTNAGFSDSDFEEQKAEQKAEEKRDAGENKEGAKEADETH